MTKDESEFENTHPTAASDGSKRAILLVAHGSTSEPETGAIARRLRTELFYDEDMDATVEVAFWKEEPAIDAALDSLVADQVYILPLLMSDGFFFRECFPAMLGIEATPGEWQADDGREVFYDYPIGESPFLMGALTELVDQGDEQLDNDRDGTPRKPSRRSQATIIVVGHGTPRNPESTKEVHRRVHKLREQLPHRDIRAAFIDDSPALHTVIDEAGESAIIIPWFIADGMHPTVDIPAAMKLPRRETETWRVDQTERRRIALAPALGSVATFGRVIGQMAHAAFRADIRHPERLDSARPGVADQPAIRSLEECLYQEETQRFGDLVIRTDSDRYESEAFQVQIRREEDGLNGGTLLEPDVAQFERSVVDARQQQTPVPYAQDNEHLEGGFTTDDIELVARAIDTVYPGAVYAWHLSRIGEKPASFAEYTASLPSRLSKHAGADSFDVQGAVSTVCDSCCQRTPHWHRPDAECANNLSCRAPCHAIYKALG